MSSEILFIYVYLDEGMINTFKESCVFQSWQKIGIRFNKCDLLVDLKQKINIKIVTYCGKQMLRLL